MTMTQYLRESLVSKKESETTSLDRMIINKTDLRVLNALLKNQPATRMDLCEISGIPRTTIYDSLTRLIIKKVVIKYSNPSTSKGRPKIYYKVV